MPIRTTSHLSARLPLEHKLQVLAKVWRETSCTGEGVNRGGHRGNSVKLSQKTESNYDMIQRSHSSVWIQNTQTHGFRKCTLSSTHSSVIYSGQAVEATWAPISRWVGRREHEIQMYIYAQGMPRSYKSKMSPFAETWIDLKDIILSETCQSEKDQYCLIPLPCGI